MVDVSVVIPAYNRAALLAHAVESCREPRLAVEVIVVDDASTDGTREVVVAYGPPVVPVVLPTNVGHCRARNVGLARARGEWVKFLDSDDRLAAESLVAEVEVGRRRGADVVVSGWGTCRVDGSGAVVSGTEALYSPPALEEPRIDALLRGEAVPTSAALYRRAHIVGLEWDPVIKKLDDWDWFVRVALQGGAVYSLDRCAYWMCSHAGARVTSGSTMLVNARDHHAVLGKLERAIAATGQLTRGRRLRLAQYYYKELRVLSLYDRFAFEQAASHILELDPDFVPIDEERDWWMRWLARVLGFRRATLLHSAIKRQLKRQLL